jgi:hypothetical protein
MIVIPKRRKAQRDLTSARLADAGWRDISSLVLIPQTYALVRSLSRLLTACVFGMTII